MTKMIKTSMVYLFLGLFLGVFYREFTKWNGFVGLTTLRGTHTHALVLGTLFFLIAAIFCFIFKDLPKTKEFKWFYTLYNISLPFMLVMMIIRGVIQVLHITLSKMLDAMISGFAGLSHIFLGIALYLFIRCIYVQAKQYEASEVE